MKHSRLMNPLPPPDELRKKHFRHDDKKVSRKADDGAVALARELRHAVADADDEAFARYLREFIREHC